MAYKFNKGILNTREVGGKFNVFAYLKWILVKKCFRVTGFIAILIFSRTVFSSESIIKIINLSTVVENEKSYSYTIDEFKFEQPDLSVEVNKNSNNLMPVSTNLILKTNVPSNFPAGYVVTAKELNSRCESASGEVTAENFAHYILGETELVLNNDVFFDDLEPMQDGLGITKKFMITFDDLADVSLKTSRCKGNAILIASLDF